MQPGAAFVPFARSVCGLAELAGYRRAGVSHLLSILDPELPLPEDLRGYAPHSRLELRFHDVIEERPGMLAPRAEDVEAILDFGRRLDGAVHLLVHCHAGISRSTAAMALVLAQARPDRPAEEALAEVVRIRPHAWPNLRLIELGDALLGQGGALVGAVRAHYRRVLSGDPAFGALMRLAGRGREVDGPGG